jgi:hypothetical protein
MLWIPIRIDFGRLDPKPDPDQGGKNAQKIRKNQEISCFEVLDVLS